MTTSICLFLWCFINLWKSVLLLGRSDEIMCLNLKANRILNNFQFYYNGILLLWYSMQGSLIAWNLKVLFLNWIELNWKRRTHINLFIFFLSFSLITFVYNYYFKKCPRTIQLDFIITSKKKKKWTLTQIL